MDPPATHKVIDTAFITDHLAKLAGLTAKKTYYYKITSKDASGQAVTASGTFITK